MSKGVLEFNLLEEETEFLDAVNGGKYRVIINEILVELRSIRKYHNKDSVSIEQIENFIYQQLDDRGLSREV